MRSDDPLVAAPVRERERMHRVTVDDAGGDPIAPGALLPTARDSDDGRMRTLVEWGVIIAIAFAFIVRGFAFQTFYIPSESMVPRLETDDRVLVNKLTYDLRDPARGDVVVFRTPPNAKKEVQGMDDLVKRVIGMPGETIEGKDGHVYINGKLLPEPWLDANVQSKPFAPVHVPANSYFMLGDNRQYSNDSTVWG